MDEEFYNRYYITTRYDDAITNGWSDGPHPEMDLTNAICINDKGAYQFRLYPDGEENPSLFDMNFIPLYKYVNGEVIRRTEEEIEAERVMIPEPPPSAQEQLRADVDYLAVINGINLSTEEVSPITTFSIRAASTSPTFLMALKYYPRLWNLERINTLQSLGRLTEEEVRRLL